MTQDAAAGRLKRLEEFTLMDLESVRLILRGDSVIDWHRLQLESEEEAQAFLITQEFYPDEPGDRARLESLKDDAIAYLRRNFDFPIPKPVAVASVEEVLLLASGKGHRQVCACTILKAMHIIHHLDGRELLFSIPMSDQDVFHLVEEKVYRVIGGMLAAGFPITEFIGGRKNKDSLYTKLLSKAATSASAIYDKLRFRIVTRGADDILPVLLYLSERLFPFNYVMPGQSINTIFPFRSYCEGKPHLRVMIKNVQMGLDDELTPSDNSFSDQSYRVIHFVVDLPVRLPSEIMDMAPPAAWQLGPIIFVMCEFQLVDRETEAANELGDASHAKYKERQKQAVMRRLKLGVRSMGEPRPVPKAAQVKRAFKAGQLPSRARVFLLRILEMRLFVGQIPALSEEIVKALVDNHDIECESRREVVRDVEAVFESYLHTEREAVEKAKSLLTARSLPQSEFNRIKKLAAEQKGIKIGEDMLDFLLDQLIEMLMHSNNVEEVYVEDHDLRRRMRPALKKYLVTDEVLDSEVRAKLKHVQEGSRMWEVEYQRVMGELQRRKGMV